MSLNQELYNMIFKRKSFHLFRDLGNYKISDDEIKEIKRIYSTFIPLDSTIKTMIKIVPGNQTTCSRGQEYCVLLYSEKKDNYLQNIGYLGEQLDLYLVSKNIGTLWYGIGKPEVSCYEGLEFVIMIAINKVDDESKFRKYMFKSKRKPVEEFWEGKVIPGVTDIVRFSPSACNTQPWIVEYKEDKLQIFRYKKPGKRGIMPKDMVTFYNQIDIGIFLCFLDLCLQHENIIYNKKILIDLGLDEEKTLEAIYSFID